MEKSMTNDKVSTQPIVSFVSFDDGSVAQPNWPTNVPAEKLSALMHASNEMMQSSFRRNRKTTLKTLARHVYDLLKVEASGVFLVSPNNSEQLVLEATVTDVWGDSVEPKQLKISDAPQSGMTSYVAAIGEIVRLHGAELENHPNNAKNRAHLLSGASHSLLGIPLKNRKEQLLGVITASNKKNVDGVSTTAEFFDEIDESIARILADQVVVVLENLRIFETLTNLLQKTHSARNLQQILHTILTEGISLLNADRGEIALWDESKHNLIITAQSGESKKPLLGEPAPTPSIVRTLWNSNKSSIFIPDVATAMNYHETNSQTKCEVAARLKAAEREIGVINVESFKINGLDQQDIEVLELLAQYAAIAYQIVDKERRFRDIVAQLGNSRPPKEVLTGILESVRDIYGLGSGIVYIADDAKRILRCSAFISEEEVDIDHPEAFSYKYEDKALATRVLHTKVGYFCEDPSRDTVVNPKGLNAFRINSPIVGVPLLFEDQVTGVLVGWSNQNPKLPKREHIEELKPFARLAAANIDLSESVQKRKVALNAIQDILAQMQTELSLEKNLRLILHGVQAAGFDRVRVYRTDEKNQFLVALDALGANHPSDFIGCTLLLTRPYTEQMIRNAEIDRSARIYDPRSSGLGPDPDAVYLGKPIDLPWAIVPLVIGGKLYGQITADNAINRQEISTENLDYLTLLGALAAQAIANSETIDTLRASKLKDEFLQRMAHIFGTSTAGVRVLTENLRKGIVSSERALNEYMPAIVKLNDRFLGLAQNLIDFAALREDTKLNINSCDFTVIINDVTELLSTIASEKQVQIKVALPESNCLWQLDSVRVITALEALLDNAIKFSPPSSTITITLQLDSNQAHVMVRDEGPGIPNEDLRFVFDSFYRGQLARQRHIDGTGLGLAIVAQTMNLHGGRVDVRNHPEGGAEFMLTFPKSSKDAQEELSNV